MSASNDVLHADFSGGLGNQLFALLSLIASGQPYCCCRAHTPSSNPHSTTDYTTAVFQALPQTCSSQRGPSPGSPRHAYHPAVTGLATQIRLPEVDPLEGAFLHIRGGDYLGHPVHFVDLTEYYQAALRCFPPDTHFYVFTNDRAYADRQEWLSSISHSFVECDEVTGLAFMKACTLGGICSNSTYAWWGAALNPSRTIVLPSRWMNTLEQPDYRIPGCIVEEVGLDAYCIHLPHRSDRLAHIARLQAAAPWLHVHLVDAVHTPEAGWKGCLQSHQAVVRYAKDNRFPYVLVLEDDCDLLVSPSEFKAALVASIDYLTTTPSAQIVSGCGNLVTKTATMVDSRGGVRFLTAPDVRTTHCILYSAASYDAVLSFDPDIPIDDQMNRCNIVFTYPYLATQRPGHSDIQDASVEYTNIEASRAFVQNLLEPPRVRQEVQQPVNLRPVFRIPIRTKRV